jgi:hypothetical protein
MLDTLQATFPEQPGLILVVRAFPSPFNGSPEWGVKLWDWRTVHQEFPSGFPTRDDARAWAEREFLIDPAAWEACRDAGSPESIAGVVKRVYRRRLTCAEAAAFARIAYGYEFLDSMGRAFWPGDEVCIVSFNVVADALDSVDWERDGCDLFPTDATHTYGFVADSNHPSNTDAIETSPEFTAMWDAFCRAGGVSAWWKGYDVRPLPRAIAVTGDGPLAGPVRALLEEERSPNYETGALARALAIPVAGRVLRADHGHSRSLNEAWSDVRSIQVAAVGGRVEVLLQRRLPDGSCRSYRTGIDGVLRNAAVRAQEHGPLEVLSIDDERARFAEELEAWCVGPPAEPQDAADVHSVHDEELRVMSRRLASPNGAEALDEALSLLQARGVFVAEAMNQAPPHVVLRVVESALRRLVQRQPRT